MTAFDPLPPPMTLAQACEVELRQLGCKVYPSGVLVPAALGEPTAEMMRFITYLDFPDRSPRLERIHARLDVPCIIFTNPERQAWWIDVLRGTAKAYPNDGCQQHALHDGYNILMCAAQEALRIAMLGTYQTADRALDQVFDAVRAAEAVAEVAGSLPDACRELWDYLAAKARCLHAQAMKRQGVVDAEQEAAAQKEAAQGGEQDDAKKEAHR